MDRPSAVLHLRTWLPAHLDVEFSQWCDDHHREQLALPGFRRARRFELVSATFADAPRFLTMYDLDDLGALTSPEYARHREVAPPIPESFGAHLRVLRRDCIIEAALPATWWPAPHTTELDEFHLNDLGLVSLLHSVDASTFPGFQDDMVLRVLSSGSDDSFVLFDHGDDDTSGIDHAVATSGATRSRWRCVFDEPSPPTSVDRPSGAPHGEP